MKDRRSRIGARVWLVVALLGFVLQSAAQPDEARADGYRIVDLPTERMPSLGIARSGHATFCLDGELVVFGGHTDGFVPTATAEYFSDGEWHTIPLVYPHDHSIALQLRSGKVLLAGGHKEPLGIGQLFSAEVYDPATHTSQGFGCLDRKRAYANALEMADGQVVISGNWFGDDGVEMFNDMYNPMHPNSVRVKEVSYPRAKPYILRISDDDAIIFSSLDDHAKVADCGIVDRLNGPAYREPFLDTWQPISTINIQRSLNQFVGDEAEGRYEWLLPVENPATGRVAIARVKGPESEGENAEFSLLPTQQPLPDSINGKAVVYSSLVCDRDRGIAYLIGDTDDARIFVVAIPYNSPEPSPLTIYMTEPQPIMARGSTPVLTPNGDLVFAGGHLINNFSPSDSVFRLPLGIGEEKAGGGGAWWWFVIAGVLIGIVVAIAIATRKKPAATSSDDIEPTPVYPIDDASIDTDKNLTKEEVLSDLFRRIQQLMETDKLYLNPNIKVSDVAALVGSNTAYVSAAINSQHEGSFSQFITSYRIKHAQGLMRENPERKISEVSTLSGFSTDSTFFRAFRSVTGMSPKEWLAAMHDNQPK